MRLNAETQRTRSGAELLGLRREAQRHAGFARAGRVEGSLRLVRSKAVSSLRSVTAVQDAFGTKKWHGNFYGVMKKLIEVRSKVRK